MRPLEKPLRSAPDSLPGRLSDDTFVMLDPAVEVVDATVSGHHLLSHGHFDAGMVVPPGDGLLDFVTTLMPRPIRLAALRAQYDDQGMIDKMLASLHGQGFMHVTSAETPSAQQLALLRRKAWQMREPMLRRSIVVDLDTLESIEQLTERLSAEPLPPEVLLRCSRLSDHRKCFDRLARLRQGGALRMHQTVVQTCDLVADHQLRQSLLHLGASVTVEDVAWPVPDRPIAGLDEIVRACIPVHVLMAPDQSICDEAARSRMLGWAASRFISGLRLVLDVRTLWPDGDAGDDDFARVFDALSIIENEFGDVLIENLPSDEVLLGNTATSLPSGPGLELADRFRRSYLRWRLPLLKSCENDNSWSQTPEVEDKLVRAGDDLLPNHPELLKLQSGSIVVDVCGGLGRVARRLSPAVGRDGLVISIEMFRCLSDRARRFACERDITNLQFRPGLAQRIPLPDATADAAVNEWTGGIWELGMGPVMVREMARVVRPGGRIAATHRLVQLQLSALAQPWVQYARIYAWMREAFAQPELTIVTERIWGQIVPSLVGENATLWRKQYMPRLINPFDVTYRQDENPDTRADVYLTIIAQRN